MILIKMKCMTEVFIKSKRRKQITDFIKEEQLD